MAYHGDRSSGGAAPLCGISLAGRTLAPHRTSRGPHAGLGKRGNKENLCTSDPGERSGDRNSSDSQRNVRKSLAESVSDFSAGWGAVQSWGTKL